MEVDQQETGSDHGEENNLEGQFPALSSVLLCSLFEFISCQVSL